MDACRPALAGLRVLVLTSGGRPGDLERCRQLGHRRLSVKPVTPADLMEGVAALLQAGRLATGSRTRASQRA